MRPIFICLLSLLTFSAQGYALQLGDELPDDARPAGYGLMISSSQFSDAYKVDQQGVVYFITVDPTFRVNYITPQDPFITLDGIRVGSTYEEVRAVTQEPLRGERGWGTWIPLPTGWNAAFCVGAACDTAPGPTAKVAFLFKRKR